MEHYERYGKGGLHGVRRALNFFIPPYIPIVVTKLFYGKKSSHRIWPVSAKAMYEIVKGLKVEVDVSNGFDKDYGLTDGYPEPGRTYFMK
ncbi:MAG: Vitamin B12 transporter BtuB [Syntrophorhabdus sp. PtaU1.Bin153]|nr:MAG: Vitamin B12 transporter BtuB [Syntrophorhabdus sp. PtaU1.Bin153]